MTDVQIGSLRLDPRDDAELEWFFNRAEGEMGARSSFASFEHQCMVGAGCSAGRGGDPYTERQMAAAKDWRRISRTLDRMPEDHARTLRRWATHGSYRPVLVETFGRLTGLAMLVALRRAMSVDDLETACTSARHAKGDARALGAAVVASVRQSAEAMMVAAVAEWNQARPARSTSARAA